MARQTDYLALLRGINVGGKNLIKMHELRAAFEELSFTEVATYIASGNVMFRSKASDLKRLTTRIEKHLTGRFGYDATVVVVSHEQLREIVDGAPSGFGRKPDDYLSDVLFLKPTVDPEEAIVQIPTHEEVDTAAAGQEVIYFSRLASKRTRSRLSRIAQLSIYKQLTIRSWSTTTKLLGLMDARLADRA